MNEGIYESNRGLDESRSLTFHDLTLQLQKGDIDLHQFQEKYDDMKKNDNEPPKKKHKMVLSNFLPLLYNSIHFNFYKE